MPTSHRIAAGFAAAALLLTGCTALQSDPGDDLVIADQQDLTAQEDTVGTKGLRQDLLAETHAELEAEAEAIAAEQAQIAAEEEARRQAEEERRRREEEEAARRAAEEERQRQEELERNRARVSEVLQANGYGTDHHGVMAFQKVHGLSRDGQVGPEVIGAIDSVQEPPLVGGAATRIEIDLDRQVLHYIRNGARVRTFNAASGNGSVYTWKTDGYREDVAQALALTPTGSFTIDRRVAGERESALGSLWNPMYFHGGWAIHGSSSVPAYPASHGCVRLSTGSAEWLFNQVPNGTQVVIHGSTNAFNPSADPDGWVHSYH